MSWRWAWLCFGLVWACSDDDGPARGGLDASLDAALPDLDSTRPPDGASTTDGDVCAQREQELPVMSAFHVRGDVKYSDPPPVGGDHNECWAPWAVYDEELADERWVHNLEHGGVIFLYNCPQGCANDVASMRVFVSGRTQALLTPYAALTTRYAVVAWGVRLTTNCFDMPAFQQFYQEHVDDAPESIADDPPRSCR
ncbi:MAG TPA: DUF3105 domain-containing protein [Polyangiales bacterium]|nr:DUF3105 domain-containing protein [Polyangiales bacterium]